MTEQAQSAYNEWKSDSERIPRWAAPEKREEEAFRAGYTAGAQISQTTTPAPRRGEECRILSITMLLQLLKMLHIERDLNTPIVYTFEPLPQDAELLSADLTRDGTEEHLSLRLSSTQFPIAVRGHTPPEKFLRLHSWTGESLIDTLRSIPNLEITDTIPPDTPLWHGQQSD